jgi:hypothetical protein
VLPNSSVLNEWALREWFFDNTNRSFGWNYMGSCVRAVIFSLRFSEQER